MDTSLKRILFSGPEGVRLQEVRLQSESKPHAAQAQDVNKLFNSDTVTQRTIYRDCMGNLPLC